MADPSQETLAGLFKALIEERERSWPPEQLARNLAQRQDLLTRFDPEEVVRPGDRLPEFELSGLDGGTLRRADFARGKPFVLLFFRYSECPACSLALPHYARHLWPDLAALGIPLIAVSPQIPEKLRAIKDRFALPFAVASDGDNRLARQLGLTFVPSEQPDPPPAGWIGELTGTGRWELPQPAVVVADGQGIVRFVAVSPDWLDRPEAGEILDAVESLSKRAAA